MRTFGRIFALNPDGTKQKPQPAGYPKWVEVQTDADGFNDWVYVTTLCQVLLLNLGESPFYANYGIPDRQAVIQQIAPDYYVALTQQQFSRYFANLVIARVPGGPDTPPVYKVNMTTNQGVKVAISIPT